MLCGRWAEVLCGRWAEVLGGWCSSSPEVGRRRGALVGWQAGGRCRRLVERAAAIDSRLVLALVLLVLLVLLDLRGPQVLPQLVLHLGVLVQELGVHREILLVLADLVV